MDALFPVGTSGIVHTERVNYLVGSPAAGPTYVGAIQRYVLGSGFNLDPNNAVFCVFPGNLEDLTNVLRSPPRICTGNLAIILIKRDPPCRMG